MKELLNNKSISLLVPILLINICYLILYITYYFINFI